MVVTLEEASPFIFSFTLRRVPRIIIYRNVEYYYGSELGSYSGLTHGELYRNAELMLSRIEITRAIRAELRIAVIFIFVRWNLKNLSRSLNPPKPGLN